LHECRRRNNPQSLPNKCFIIEEHGRGKHKKEIKVLEDMHGKTAKSLVMPQDMQNMRIRMELGSM
jgi:hypothetical protein